MGFFNKMNYYVEFLERGKFLALDLGGTNFRILLVHLKEENRNEIQSKTYTIPDTIMLGSGQQLFDYIAECLAYFMKVLQCKILKVSSS